MDDVINSTLAAKFSLHQEKQLSVADGLADFVDEKLQTILNRMVRVLRSKAGPTEKKYAIRSDLYKVILIAHEIMAKGLESMAINAHADAATVLVKTLPKGHLGLITERKPVLEDRKAEMEAQIKDMIFDPLSPEKISTIVRGTTAGASWQSRLAQQTSLAPPEHLAAILTQDFNGQKTPAELARVLKDHVQGVASTARRVARNESMRIAHESRMDAYEDLGDMVIGYQIHATMDSRVRPHHAARSGTVYYKKPVSGQLGLDKMPRPPIEEDGTVAHNCRCWITPVLSVSQEVEKDPAAKKVFSDNAGKLIPNPAVYTDWFDRAPEADKARVVGPKRLKVMRDQLLPGEKINWGHFVNPVTGRLLDVAHLENEAFEARQKRLKKFTQLIWKRKQLTHKVYTYGYLPPKTSKKKSSQIKKLPAFQINPSQIQTDLGKPIEPTLPPPALPSQEPNRITYIQSKTDAEQLEIESPLKLNNTEKHFVNSKEIADDLKTGKYSVADDDNVFDSYILGGYSSMNFVARNPNEKTYGPEGTFWSTKPVKQKIALMDKLIQKHGTEIPVGTVAYRGTKKMVEALHQEKGFTSISLDYNQAAGFGQLEEDSRHYTLKFMRPVKGLYVPLIKDSMADWSENHRQGQAEKEIILERNIKIMFTNERLPDGTYGAYVV